MSNLVPTAVTFKTRDAYDIRKACDLAARYGAEATVTVKRGFFGEVATVRIAADQSNVAAMAYVKTLGEALGLI